MGALRTGGQGSVYKGKRMGEIITAVKILPTPIHSESPDDKHFIDFQNEVNKLKKVNKEPHPNVVSMLSSGITESGSLPYIEMEYIEGPDLEELLKPPHDPIFTIKEAIKVADHLSNALAHCHKHDVKHGDIKSNNVKFNIRSGNYVLLDFGMAMMSDEQRRTSLRQAGAIEFMAPEQNEGRILFETDVYSFGIVMYELLAGVVPFPLYDRGETSRNNVMLSHIEANPPDLLELRRKNIPEEWSEEKKQVEMQVPAWLVETIETCLRKKPENRFASGVGLHEHICLKSTAVPVDKNLPLTEKVNLLQQRNDQLQRENEELQQKLWQFQHEEVSSDYSYSQYDQRGRKIKKGIPVYAYLLLLIPVVGALGVGLYKYRNAKTQNSDTTARTQPRTIGQYKVVSSRAYFHDSPDAATRRTAYLVPSSDVITASDEKNGFIYAEFTNSRAQRSKGWLKKSDLMTVDEWSKKQLTDTQGPRLNQEDINLQLADARDLMESKDYHGAVYIYKFLVAQEITEAMYEYGNLGLQGRNDEIDCTKAYQLVTDAADKGYIPAKRTLGFLYFFADNQDVLQMNDYFNCKYQRNVYKGTRLLIEAFMAGDSTAKKLVDELELDTRL